MKRFVRRAFFAALVILSAVSCRCPKYESYTDTIEVNGVSLFYAAEGCGKPVILLHGNGGSHNTFETTTRQLAQAGYMVYAIDSRGQGANKALDEYHYKDMATDVKEFIDAKGLVKPAVFGYSDGGIIALTLATRYPDIPGAIISCGANTSPKTMKPYFIIGVKFNNMFHHDKLNDMMLTLPDITAEMLGEITAPTYIVAGEHDIMWLSDTAYMYRKIPNSRIAIIKGAGHSTYMSHDGKQAYILAKGFFDTL